MGNTVVTGHTVHGSQFAFVQSRFVKIRLHICVFGNGSIFVVDPYIGDFLFQGIRRIIVHPVDNVPVDAAPQPFPLCPSPGLHHQINAGPGVILIVCKTIDHAQAVVGEGLGEVAFLTGIACRPQRSGTDREMIQFEDLVIGFLEPLGFARQLVHKRGTSDMAFLTGDIGMRGLFVHGILGRHGMAGSAAEFRGVRILPAVHPAGNHEQRQYP